MEIKYRFSQAQKNREILVASIRIWYQDKYEIETPIVYYVFFIS
jgi:hypothetical protein